MLGAADIVEVVSGYTSLRKRGSTHVGLCPFHQEKTPSFSVSADKGLYYCFGCGQGGNLVTFVRQMENLSFAEAVELLADRFRVPLKYEEVGQIVGPARDRDRRLLALLSKAASFYQRYLWQSERGRDAREYLRERGLGEEVCREYMVGLSPGEWRGLHRRALQEGFTERELEDAGLVVRRPGAVYDRFRGRLMFPLVDHRGRVVGFGGRALADESPKYLNSPEGPLYQKGQLLYGLYQARSAISRVDEVLVVEGYTDVLALAQAGLRHCVASMGTALTEAQLALMNRFTAHMVFMFDADRAGVEAVRRSGELARKRSLRPLVVALPSGQDPADILKSGAPSAVQQLVSQRVSLLRYEISLVLDRSDIGSAEGRVRAFEEIRPILARATSPKEKEEEIATIADRLRLSPDTVALLLNERERAVRSAPRHRGPSNEMRLPDDRPLGVSRLLSRDALVEREFLAASVCHPSLALPLLEGISGEHFVEPAHRQVFLGLQQALKSNAPAPVFRDLAQEDSEAGSLFARLAIEAEEQRYSAAVLRELHLRLWDQHLARTIAELKGKLSEEEVDPELERRLYHLELRVQQVRTMLSNLEEA